MNIEFCKILVVDDDKFILDTISLLLQDFEQMKFDVEYACNGAEAKRKFLTFHPDFVVTDIVMPDMDGFELTIYMKTSDLPPYVAVMSGTTQHNLDIAKLLGSDFVFDKSCLFEQLPAALQEYKYSH